jgi:hypothetical protein
VKGERVREIEDDGRWEGIAPAVAGAYFYYQRGVEG